MSKTSKKPLHVYEQSMLLVTILLARKNIDEILSFLPAEQIERMNLAKNRFLRFEQSDRVTKIILELRRLLLLSQRDSSWINQSWINSALQNEPDYLKPIIKNVLNSDGTKGLPKKDWPQAFVPGIIFHSFLNQFECTQKKVAIFDPIIMRLQTMNEQDQELTLAKIGQYALPLLASQVNRLRLQQFVQTLTKEKFEFTHELAPTNNPFSNETLRLLMLRHIIGLKHRRALNVYVEVGLCLIAGYLSTHSPSWQKTTALILQKPLGQVLLRTLHLLPANTITPKMHELIKDILIMAIEVD